jgi:hypothetical protein
VSCPAPLKAAQLPAGAKNHRPGTASSRTGRRCPPGSGRIEAACPRRSRRELSLRR